MDIARFQQLLGQVLDAKIAETGATVAERTICSILKRQLPQLDQDSTLALLDSFAAAAREIRSKIRAQLARAR